ncbi:hypothetical protein PA0641 [Candidatus Phytoplasma australiense]|uniref:Uncharacterized protein n=2 Tax=Phytoplasma australiense TaxID=59748 RepID=B1VAK2_PHYAS|nr:hypothetical protein [Candidatus Phytoplasma australiense]AGL90373.1 hypothetical protein SLY_0453 [Strawberry lethal yellows phytoplasma (CPA) str. NZSb11]CAM11975.1 hypothetical protein PA0641 [Candidatus Phytoplasma australiense]
MFLSFTLIAQYNKKIIISILIFSIIIFLGFFIFINYRDFFENEAPDDVISETTSLIEPTPAVSEENSSQSKIDIVKDKVLNKLGTVADKMINSQKVNKYLNDIPNKLTSLVIKDKKTKK